jgi:L-serine dehydratase
MLSAFEIIGPPMVGPSSSHTAGACRIGLMARQILAEAPRRAVIGLHGSFAATGQGHATDRALIAGVLGLAPDDERLKDSPALAVESDLEVVFEDVDLGEQMHPNSVRLALQGDNFATRVTGSSVGGGAIVIVQIDEYSVDIRGTLETAVMWHLDTPGFLGRIATVCACVELNIASMRTSRHERGESALTTLEVDGRFDADLLSVLRRSKGMQRLVHIPVLPGF